MLLFEVFMINNNSGQGMVEYMILVALIAAGTIGVVRVVGYNIGAQYENINRALGAKNTNQLQIQNADQSQLNKKDLSDFLKGSR
jgi:pilus assembly protein Flp/PilA